MKTMYPIYKRVLRYPVSRLFFLDLVSKTRNFSDVTWLGQPIWQNILDLWTIQETLAEVKPELLIECGTNRGGSALFYAHLFDLMGHGRVLTIDVAKMHELTHPRIEFVVGSSVEPAILARVDEAAKGVRGPIMVILDSDHSAAHVRKEMDAYCRYVTPDSFMLVQDGVIDTLSVFREGRPGPVPAIRAFLREHPEFLVDQGRTDRFLITHHPLGWLRRLRT